MSGHGCGRGGANEDLGTNEKQGVKKENFEDFWGAVVMEV